jgi:murein DD-endopeptidase MepM/ murein hydrolase activator NlpD
LKSKDVELPYFYGNSHFPALQLYGNWETKHTYREENKISLGATIECILTDSFNFCGFSKAVAGQVSSNFGYRDKRMHFGIDFSCKHGDSIFSVFDGVVRFAGRDGGFGNVVVVRHYNGLETLYAHLSKISVKTGDEVHFGQMIGKAGNTGKSHGTHLHFEVRLLGKPIDPNHILNVQTWQLHDNEVVINEGINHLHAYPKMAKYHVVKKGELLYQIAERYGLSVKQISELNHLGKRKNLYLGQKLRIG